MAMSRGIGERRPRVYFARAVDGQDREALDDLVSLVRHELDETGLELVDPVATEPEFTGPAADSLGRHRAIVDHDLLVLRSCQAVLMDISIPGHSYIGCICEMLYAYSWHIPCVVYMGDIDSNRPWLRYHATEIVQSRAEAIGWLRDLLVMRPAPAARTASTQM
jgi:hypothetical protein